MPNKLHIRGAHHLGEFTYTHMPAGNAFIRHSNANRKPQQKHIQQSKIMEQQKK